MNEGYYKEIFDRYGGIMRAKQLDAEKVFYAKRQRLIKNGYVEKVRTGYYQWVDPEDFSEIDTVKRLFPDAIFCMDTALIYYGYSDRIPREWHVAVSKDSGKSRFRIDIPRVRAYYVEPSLLEIGLTTGEKDGHSLRIYDRERVICDCLRYRKKIDREIFTKAIRTYVMDPQKNLHRLLEYAEQLRVKKIATDLIDVWL